MLASSFGSSPTPLASSSSSTTSSSGSSTTPPAADSTASTAVDKTKAADEKEIASTDKPGVKNEPAKKMYCN
jgi:hypothetical protein